MPPRRKVRALYRITELATLLGFDDRTVCRWLESQGVPIVRLGKRKGKIVWTADLFAALPELERSLHIAHESTQD